jgi:hypothetical protein
MMMAKMAMPATTSSTSSASSTSSNSSASSTSSTNKNFNGEYALVDISKIQDAIDLIEVDIRGVPPMLNSSLRNFCKKIKKWNVFNFDRGVPLISTFFSGGTINVHPHLYLNNLLPLKADDICNAVILTDNEIVSNVYGFKVFFELDYREIIPTQKTMMKHVSIAQNLLKEVFEHSDATVMISTSEKKIKKNSKTGKNMAAFGVHLVFPEIIIDTTGLKRLAVTLDSRITNDNHVWAGVVDASSIHARHASLRPNFSYKTGICPVHSILKKNAMKIAGRALSSDEKQEDGIRRLAIIDALAKKNGSKKIGENEKTVKKRSKKLERKKSIKKSYLEFGQDYNNLTDDDDDKSDEDDYLVLEDDVKCSNCFFGKVVLPSTYRLECVKTNDGKMIDYTVDGEENITVLEELKMTSIVFVGCTSNIHILAERLNLPIDFADELDILAPKKGAVFSKEKTVVHAANKRVNNAYVSFDHPIYSMLPPLLEMVNIKYRETSIQNIMVDREKKSIIINVKGSNSRFCCMKNHMHNSNRVYFVISLSTGMLQARCFDSECTKKRAQLFPFQKNKNVFSSNDLAMKKILCLKLPDETCKKICISLDIPFKKSQFSSNMPSNSVVTKSANVLKKKRGKDEVDDDDDDDNNNGCGGGGGVAKKQKKTEKLADLISGDDELSRMLSAFDIPREQRLKFAKNNVFGN